MPERGALLLHRRGRRVAMVTSEAGLPIACGTVDAIVAQVPAGFACRSLIPTVDRIDNWRHGAFALWLDSGRHHGRERQRQPRRPALGAASGLGQGTRPPGLPETRQEEADAAGAARRDVGVLRRD